jgi:MbtH protein
MMTDSSLSRAGDEEQYAVVVNDEEQYSIWSARRAAPEGWRQVGVTGTKQECLTHIEKVWTDMRPLSLRRAMDGERAA